MNDYRFLLKDAALLYEKYKVGRPRPFNVFTVLRSETDEVNLHSAFLHALLDYKKPDHTTRENLADFLHHVGAGNFGQYDLKIEPPERYNIDILITTDNGQHAIVIENKIRARDMQKQLCRYYNTLKKQGCGNIHLLYLTLNGNAPSETTFCGLDCEARSRYEAISYKDTITSWLRRCQQRAYDEPGLRESIAQYRQLVRKLTGMDSKGVYMDKLTKLVLEGDNLVLAHELNKAVIQAKVQLLKQLWCEIDAALRNKITCLPPIDEAFHGGGTPGHASEEKILNFFVGNEHFYHGLHYSLDPLGHDGAHLAIGAASWRSQDDLIFGIYCAQQQHPQTHAQLVSQARKVAGGNQTEWWPWHQYAAGLQLGRRNPDHEAIRTLLNKAAREAHAASIAQRLKSVWDAIK